jgi:NAD-dependent DNA ligase
VDDQCAVTKVLEVEWHASKTGTWIPRLRLEPVVIGSATIQYCTGFNAKYIEENKLSSDSIIKLRRSGDVIPVVDTIVKATGPSMPPEGTWKWDESHTHAVLLDPSSNVTVIMKGLVHSVTTFGVEGFRGASAMTLCDGGVTTVAGILTAGKAKLQSLLGNVVGSKLFDSLNEKIRSASPETWILAAPCWSKGFGSRKLTAVYETEPDIGKWGSLDKAVKGVSLDGIEEIQKMLPQYYAWRKSIQDVIVPSPVSVAKPTKPAKAAKPAKQEIGQVCVSGFRDAEFVEKLANKGYGVSDSVKKTTSALFVADTTKTSTKIETAKKYNIPIFGRNMLDSFFHSLK